ncbi:hypothetical protein [Bradyrhizobium sp.]|uniref:hypothetical protein n=1 Tax=Bradyrhizobium sp. TaxID=376 RepID=UPI003C4BDF2B
MTTAAARLEISDTLLERRSEGERAPGLSDLFVPLDDLLLRGGDQRLALDPASRLNAYGCGPMPAPDTLNFSSSTASPISARADERAGFARAGLMRLAIAHGLEHAFDMRLEEMREELRAHLELAASDADIIFSPSGTDSQLHALFLARGLFGSAPMTIVVGADQTGSGTIHTARGRHFSALTAGGRRVAKDAPIAGLSGDSVALPLLAGMPDFAQGPEDLAARAECDSAVLDAIEAAVASGARVLLQIMDASKLGWRAPGDACLEEIAARWPRQVRIVVDACQMRLSRRRLRNYLDRGYMVLITGSKYFGGPAFSGALLVPRAISRALDTGEGIAPGLADYASRSDWPQSWTALRSRFASRPNLGQWLRWEAALAEIGTYYQVPAGFRTLALREFRATIESLIALSPALRPLARPPSGGTDDEEFADATIFPFFVDRNRSLLSADGCRRLHRALASDLRGVIEGTKADRDLAGQRCLIGQPVAIAHRDGLPVGVLRLCIGARLVTEAWSSDPRRARQNLQRERDHVASVVAKIELLLAHAGPMEFAEQ